MTFLQVLQVKFCMPNFVSGSNSSGFGGGGGLFGTSNTMNKPNSLSFGTPGFGTNTSTGFNFNQPSTGGLFGNTGSTGGGGLFGSTNTGTLSLSGGFGSNLGSTNFGSNPLQSNLNTMNNNAIDSNNLSNLIKALTHNPFGTSNLLKSSVAPTGKYVCLFGQRLAYSYQPWPKPKRLKSNTCNQSETRMLVSNWLQVTAIVRVASEIS